MGHMMNVERDLKHLKIIARGEVKDQTYLTWLKTSVLKSLSKVNLLTSDHANAKTAKNAQFEAYQSFILHLSPATMAFEYIGRRGTVCPLASAGCKTACLNTAGRGRFDSIQLSRLRKTLYFILFRDEFMSHLNKEIAKLNKKACLNAKQLVVRLNGTSDIQWENIELNQLQLLTNTNVNDLGKIFKPNIFEAYPNVQFYDYTKIVRRLNKVSQYDNYFVIFSASESNHDDSRQALALGFNVAMVFSTIPETYKGHRVINGDMHDFRFLDQGRGVIVGLKAKGKAKQDTSGFVRQTCKVVA